MNHKWSRNYLLTIEGRQDFPDQQIRPSVTVSPPFTLEFDVTRNEYSSANSANLRVYNLGADRRDIIRKDWSDFDPFRMVKLQAGYGSTNLPTLFHGKIDSATISREGTNVITTISAVDIGEAYTTAVADPNSIQPGMIARDVIIKLIETIPNVTVGRVGKFPNKLPRTVTAALHGGAVEMIQQLSGGAFFVDNGKAYVLDKYEIIPGDVQVINSESGLLGTPVLQQSTMHLDLMFDPRLLVGQSITVDSKVSTRLNGPSKIISLKHRGTISEATCGDAVTTVGLEWGLGKLVEVPA
jgi:hypothetical protein